MDGSLTLLVAREGERVRLLAPDVGWFTDARAAGAVLGPGEQAGFLVALGRARPLVVPEGVAGVVRNERPERVHEPVGHGSVLYELESLATAGALADVVGAAAEGEPQGLVFRSPLTGRYWQRPSPAEPPLVRAGDVLERGTAVGLIEVMKTFTHVLYRPGGRDGAGLPDRARVVRVLPADGAEVRQGEPLLELEPAPPEGR